MPDLKSELTKVLTEWEPKPDTPAEDTPKRDSNVTRYTFDYVKANPGVRTSQTSAYLRDMHGFKPASTTSLMAQMVRKGILRREDSCYYAVTPEYVPISSVKEDAVPPKPRAKWPKFSGEMATPQVAPKAAVDIESLSVREAHRIYLELHKFFGETK